MRFMEVESHVRLLPLLIALNALLTLSAAFETKARASHQPEQERIEYLTKKIQTKDEVLAELMAEHVALKKSLGEL